MAPSRKKHMRWSPKSIQALIKEIESLPEGIRLMGSSSAPNLAIWKKVEKKMARRNYPWKVSQLRNCWKMIKSKFYTEQAFHKIYKAHSRDPPPYYQSMLRLWKRAGKPIFRDRRRTANKPCQRQPQRQRPQVKRRQRVLSLPRLADEPLPPVAPAAAARLPNSSGLGENGHGGPPSDNGKKPTLMPGTTTNLCISSSRDQ
nr:uncharacterized protein LOC110070705 [Pogona vitticeps]